MDQEDRFADLLSKVAREVTRRQYSDVCCGTLTLEQFQTLQTIDRSERPSIGSLSAAMGVDLSTMSRNISVLERDGHLVRARSEEDSRVVRVRLLAKGRRALKTLQCSERSVLKDVYSRLSDSDRPGALKILEALRACLTKGGDEEAVCCPPGQQRKRAAGGGG
jgi:DNA-binding MarR family transcriptional regulator